MAGTVTTWLLALPLLGLATGMRTMTPIAICAWFAHLGLLPVAGTWAFWLASPVSVVVFSLAALGEFVGDKLPRTPNRTAPVGLITRLVFGGLVGAVVATSLQNSLPVATTLCILCALAGTFASYFIRHHLVQNQNRRDWPVALLEDFCTIVLAVFALRVATA